MAVGDPPALAQSLLYLVGSPGNATECTSSAPIVFGNKTRLHSTSFVSLNATVVPSLFFGLALLWAFEWARQSLPTVYEWKLLQPRSHLSPVVPPPPRRVFGWISSVRAASDADLLMTAGVDAVMLLRFCDLCLRFCLHGCAWAALLLPTYYTAAPEGQSAEGAYRFSLSNVPDGDDRLWLAVAASWALCLHLLYSLDWEYRRFVGLRQKHLTGRLAGGDGAVSNDRAHHRLVRCSLIVEQIPPELRCAESLAAYFEGVFGPGSVVSATVCLDTARLDKLLARRSRALAGLRGALREEARRARAAAKASGSDAAAGPREDRAARNTQIASARSRPAPLPLRQVPAAFCRVTHVVLACSKDGLEPAAFADVANDATGWFGWSGPGAEGSSPAGPRGRRAGDARLHDESFLDEPFLAAFGNGPPAAPATPPHRRDAAARRPCGGEPGTRGGEKSGLRSVGGGTCPFEVRRGCRSFSRFVVGLARICARCLRGFCCCGCWRACCWSALLRPCRLAAGRRVESVPFFAALVERLNAAIAAEQQRLLEDQPRRRSAQRERDGAVVCARSRSPRPTLAPADAGGASGHARARDDGEEPIDPTLLDDAPRRGPLRPRGGTDGDPSDLPDLFGLSSTLERVAGASAATATGFVTLSSLLPAATAQQAIMSHRPLCCETEAAPEPRELIWPNVALPAAELRARATVVGFLLAFAALLWAVPVAAVQVLASVDFLEKLPVFRGTLEDLRVRSPALFLALGTYLPVLALLGLIAVLPHVFEYIAVEHEGLKSWSRVEATILQRYFGYQMANIWITVVSGTIFSALSCIVARAERLPVLLAMSLPNVAVYFMGLIAVKALSGLPLKLVQVVPLLAHLGRRGARCTSLAARAVKLFCCRRAEGGVGSGRSAAGRSSPRGLEDRRAGEERDAEREARHTQLLQIRYGVEYPDLLLVLVICLVYAVLSPLIMCFGALFFFAAGFVYRYIFLYVHVPAFESGGRFWFKVFDSTLVGLLFSTLTVIGYMTLKQGLKESPWLLPLPLVVAAFYYHCDAHYRRPCLHLALDRAAELDAAFEAEASESGKQHSRSAGAGFDVRESLFVQPSLAAAPAVFGLPPFAVAERQGGLPDVPPEGSSVQADFDDI
jgi:hypothetical protein